MKKQKAELHAIGVIRSPFTTLAGMPIQTVAATGVAATVELDPSYAAGLMDIDGFSYLLLITHLHLMQGYALEVTPFMDTQPHGVFAQRAVGRDLERGDDLIVFGVELRHRDAGRVPHQLLSVGQARAAERHVRRARARRTGTSPPP